MDFKKKITLNLDAVIMIAVLFVASIAGSTFLLFQVQALSKESIRQQMQMTVDQLNLSSQEIYIKKLQEECALEK